MGPFAKWCLLTVFLGAFPYLFTAALRALLEPGPSWLPPSSSVLFLALASCVAALGELADIRSTGLGRRSWGVRLRRGAGVALVSGTVVAAVLYGAYELHTMMDPARGDGFACASSATAVPTDKDARRIAAKWSSPCARWLHVQQSMFTLSLHMSVHLLAISGSAILFLTAGRRV